MSSNTKQPSWLLIWLSCFLLCPLYTPTHSTPVLPPPQKGREEPLCPHATIAELIRTSPVILKALGARIFTDDDLNDEQNAPNGQNGQNYFLTSATLDATRATKTTSRTTRTTTTTTRTTSRTTAGATSAWNSKSAAQTGRVGYEFVESGGGGGVASSSSARGESILITLTPETIYKGASLLKMTPSAESAARSSSGGGGGGGGGGNSRSGGGGGTSADSARQYEGQLNATLEPLACFDGNVLKILPTELIAFGKLVTVQQQQQQQHDNQHPEHPVQQSDILRISINGLHRWSPQFENHIWKHLGWDDWSDFTVCSVTCGKGVQQRFRRCLLDNPMVNLNMNLNLNAVVDDNDDADEIEDDLDVIGDGNVATAVAVDDVDNDAFEEEAEIADELRIGRGKESLSAVSFVVRSLDGTADIEESNDEKMFHKSDMKNTLSDVAVTAVNGMPGLSRQWSAATTTITSVNGALEAGAGTSDASTATAEEDEDVMRVFVGNFNESPNETDSSIKNPVDVTMTSHRRSVDAGKKTRRRRQRNKRRKSAKSFSTMFCEGYNIEQRNCNTFECSDDISDLLKFYKKFPMSEDTSAALLPTLMAPPDANAPTTTTDAATPPHADAAAVAAGEVATNVAAAALLVLPSSTPANMGYVRSWRNALNFTLMLTLRVKNDSSSGGGGGGVGGSSRTTATVFSIRNATHNLYLEPCKDGLRLYLERDNTTEMLPVKFNLYDYRWHQVAISIQNGDFISIYVDCSWTNSFVVSKRLFSLPLDADVEIGRGFNGELQQLLVLPDNQERYQCSNRRTSINEVKRYIIDTFIDDYGN